MHLKPLFHLLLLILVLGNSLNALEKESTTWLPITSTDVIFFVPSKQTSTPTKVKIAIAKITAYAQNPSKPAPVLQDYQDAGITNVNAQNLNSVNEAVAALTSEKVDTVAEIQNVVNDYLLIDKLLVFNIKIKNITDHSCTVTWEGNPKVKTWLLIHKTGTEGNQYDVINHTYTYSTLGSGHTFTVYVQGEGSPFVAQEEFTTLGQADTIKPVITLKGASTITLTQGQKYTEAGASAKDDKDGTVNVRISDSININKVGIYSIIYTATDKAGNKATKTRTVKIVAKILPPITIEKLKEMIANDEDVTKVNTSQITDMSYLFYRNHTFNQDISQWDVSNVTNMYRMFDSAYAFNQNISHWDVSNVTNMALMFSSAKVFNQPIGNWNVSNVIGFYGIFMGAYVFNQPIGDWDVSSATNIGAMFRDARSFNQSIGDWNVSAVIDMRRVFMNATSFNQNLNSWDRSNVTRMDRIFYGASSFSQTMSNWPDYIMDFIEPSIILKGSSTIQITADSNMIDPGVTVTDNMDNNMKAYIETIFGEHSFGEYGMGIRNPEAGTYKLTDLLKDERGQLKPDRYRVYYRVKDAAGNASSKIKRTVIILDTTVPRIVLKGDNPMTQTHGQPFIDPGYNIYDDGDGRNSSDIQISGTVDTSKAGTYKITYTATDKAGNKASVTRTVTVIAPDTTKPVITLNGSDHITLKHGATYTELGATAIDDRDGSVTVVTTGTVSTTKYASLYKQYITYTATDKAGNKTTKVRTITVSADTYPGRIILNGFSPIYQPVGTTYIEKGGYAIDKEDGRISTRIVKKTQYRNGSDVEITLSDNFTVTRSLADISLYPIKIHYEVVDSSGHKRTTSRTVYLSQNKWPKITVNGLSGDAGSLKITEHRSGSTYVDKGATAIDKNGKVVPITTSYGTLTKSLFEAGQPSSKQGIYIVIYTAKDEAGNPVRAYRLVYVDLAWWYPSSYYHDAARNYVYK